MVYRARNHSPQGASAKLPGVADRYFEVSSLLMLATSFATLALARKLDIPSVLVVTTALGLRLWESLQGRVFNLQPSTAARLGLLCIFFYALDLLIFSSAPGLIDRILAATVHLVLFVTVIKVFSARTSRDCGYLAALSFLMMLAGAVYTVSMAYLIGLALYMLFSISTFAAYEIKRSTDAEGKSAGREKASATRSGGFRVDSRGAVEQALLRTSATLALGVVVLASLLFFVVPRYRSGYFTTLASRTEHITGFSETVNLGDIGKIKRSNAVVMRVRTEGHPRLFQGVKWRGIGLSSFDGKHWYNDNTDRTPIPPASPDRFLLPPPEGGQGRAHSLLRYRVLLSPLSTDVIFVAAVPRQLTGRLRLLFLDQTQSLHNSEHDNASFAYDVVTEAGVPSAEELRRASTDFPANIRLHYLSTRMLNAGVADLARRVTASAATNYDRALAIQSYLRQNFGYTLDPVGIEPEDPIGSFLLKSKQGYCEYFAAAMALMLRSMAIPSRLVNGFQTGTYNRVGNDFVVRARDAHTWVEVYFPGYGWIPFDPTPADPSQVAGTWAAIDDYLDALSVFWSEWIINYDFGHQVRLAREFDRQSWRLQESLRFGLRDLQRQSTARAAGIERWLFRHKWPVLCLSLLCGLTLALTDASLAQFRVFWLWKLRPRHAPLGCHEATVVYTGLLQVLRSKGFLRGPSETPREFALRVAGTPFGDAVQEFTELYTSLRFGSVPVSLARLRQLLDAIRRATA